MQNHENGIIENDRNKEHGDLHNQMLEKIIEEGPTEIN